MNVSDPTCKRALGIDFGLRRVGLAISDPLRLFARRLKTLDRAGQDDASLAGEIAGICEEYAIDTVVVGLPVRTDGRDSEMAEAATRFAEALSLSLSCKVELYDERYTSLLASRIILETAQNKKRDKGLVDRVAAEILLQDWLDREKGGLTAVFD